MIEFIKVNPEVVVFVFSAVGIIITFLVGLNAYWMKKIYTGLDTNITSIETNITSSKISIAKIEVDINYIKELLSKLGEHLTETELDLEHLKLKVITKDDCKNCKEQDNNSKVDSISELSRISKLINGIIKKNSEFRSTVEKRQLDIAKAIILLGQSGALVDSLQMSKIESIIEILSKKKINL